MGEAAGVRPCCLETRHRHRRIAGALILIVAVLVCSSGTDATPSPPPAGWNTAHAAALSFGTKQRPGSMSVANNKDPNQKQPGEKEPGKYHYNPGNMSEKTIDSGKPESQQRANIDRIKVAVSNLTAETIDVGERWTIGLITRPL